MRIAGILLLSAFLLQGCGTKGDLFLPPPEPSTQLFPDQN